jgi:hypothetical protein
MQLRHQRKSQALSLQQSVPSQVHLPLKVKPLMHRLQRVELRHRRYDQQHQFLVKALNEKRPGSRGNQAFLF